jgi:hypothetical protein
MQQLGNAVGITVSTAVFSSVGSKIGRVEDLLQCYRAAQWTSFAFGVIALALGGYTFQRGRGPRTLHASTGFDIRNRKGPLVWTSESHSQRTLIRREPA